MKPFFSDIKNWESIRLAPYAARSINAKRMREEKECPFRNPFQRDRDRIIHTKAFRRLAHKTQVFIPSHGDHYRTRLTHTVEVSQIARTLARVFGLNEDLTEAASLGHDLGHTPFGHAGERTLAALNPDGFNHQSQSLRLVDYLARDGRGLNLTMEVRDGILKHSKGQGPIFIKGESAPKTVEGQVVRVADIIAYLAHDLDDALEANLITLYDIPKDLFRFFGPKASTRIRVMVTDLLSNSQPDSGGLTLSFSKQTESGMEELRNFLYHKVYRHPQLLGDLERSKTIIGNIYQAYMTNDYLFNDLNLSYLAKDRSQAVCDYIAGMTDRYAIAFNEALIKPATELEGYKGLLS